MQALPIRRITVVGLGYIGLPTAAMLATKGYDVVGYDVNPSVVQRLQARQVSALEPDLGTLVSQALGSGHLKISTKPAAADAFILCVPTPLQHRGRKADLSYVRAATKAILPFLSKGNLLVLESTVPPGTTRDLLAPMVERAGFDPREDVDLAHCPETVLPGNIVKELVGNDRLVGGLTTEAAQRASQIYASFVKAKIKLTDATTAELVKVAQNTFRDVNIALANEMALLCREWGVDSRAAIELMNTHPRVHVHNPGPGVGGHCIPLDPWFLVQDRASGRLVRTARAVNDGMPKILASWLKRLLRGVREPKVAVLGITYKANVDDIRESPALVFIAEVRKRIPKVNVLVHDPHVTKERYDVVDLEAAVEGAHCVVITTDHREFRTLDPSSLGPRMRNRALLDTRGITDRARWEEAGFRVEAL